MAMQKDIGGTPGAARVAATNDAKRKMFESIENACRLGIKRQIENGDHAGAWETICNGPDQGSEGVWVESGFDAAGKPRGMMVTLSGGEKVHMCERLDSYARMNGWDEDAGKAEVNRLFVQRRNKLAGVAGVWKRRARA